MKEEIIFTCYNLIVDYLWNESDDCARADAAIKNGDAYGFAEDYLNENIDLMQDACDDYTEEIEVFPILAETLDEYGYNKSDYHECMTSALRRKQVLALAVWGDVLRKFTAYLEEDFEDDYKE